MNRHPRDMISLSIKKMSTPKLGPVVQHAPLIAKAPAVSCEVCVVVPVRDEAATIETTLHHLAHQKNLDGTPFPRRNYEVILLLNNCRDDSAHLACRFASRHPDFNVHVVEVTLAAEDSHVGRARRLLMDEAHLRLTSVRKVRGVIASTDADTRVADDWLAQTLREVRSGADAVGGRILLDSVECRRLPAAARRYHYFDTTYRLLSAELTWQIDPCPHDPVPRHHQHFGASFAVTAASYEKAGRLPALNALEDVALYRALLRSNARFRHSPLVRVTTSPRLLGRVAVGLSFQLREWAALEKDLSSYSVEPVAAIEMRAHVRRRLRTTVSGGRNAGRAFGEQSLISIATDIGASPKAINDLLRQYEGNNFEAIFEALERGQNHTSFWRDKYPLMPVETVVRELRRRLSVLRQGSV